MAAAATQPAVSAPGPVDMTTTNGTNGHATPIPDVVVGNMPRSWYTQPSFYELECRAVFSKQWLLMTHRCRLPEVGSYIKFQAAGYDYFFVKNGKGKIQAFHNVFHPLAAISSFTRMSLGSRSLRTMCVLAVPHKICYE